jgi:hypothetical protein
MTFSSKVRPNVKPTYCPRQGQVAKIVPTDQDEWPFLWPLPKLTFSVENQPFKIFGILLRAKLFMTKVCPASSFSSYSMDRRPVGKVRRPLVGPSPSVPELNQEENYDRVYLKA